MYTINKLKEVIEKNGFDFKKMYGQNFIIDGNIINNIVSKTAIKADSLVIEVGPGAGALTQELALVANQVLCFEVDKTLQPILNDMLKDFSNVDIIYEDFLKVNLTEILKKYNYQNIYVVANLPYYITTPIIMKLIEEKVPLQKIVVMVQKEVGNRFRALPNTKDYSSLSVFLNYYFEVKKIMDVSKNVFMPRPNVDSIVVSFETRKESKLVINEDVFFKLVRDAFKQKRKTLRNNLKDYDIEKMQPVLKKNGFDFASVRAEQLSIDIFIELANAIS